MLIEKTDQPIAAYNDFRKQLATLRDQNASVVFDYESTKGNKEARSHIYKLRQTKSAVEKTRKAEKAVALDYGRKIDAEAKSITAEIETMIAVHQKPLDEIEAREKARIRKHRDSIDNMRRVAAQTTHPDGRQFTAAELREAADYLGGITIDETWEEFIAEAAIAKDESLATVTANLNARQKYEEEQAELKRLREEAEARAKQEREEQIKRDAAERARKEAEAKARQEKEAVERKAKEEREAAERRELDLKLAAERAAREKAEAERRAEEAERIAKENAIREQEEARRRQEAAQAKREANKRHVIKINREAMACLINLGLSEEVAQAIIVAIARGEIKRVSIEY